MHRAIATASLLLSPMLCVAWMGIAACGGGAPGAATAHTLLPAPTDRGPRAAALDGLGRELFAAMKSGDYARVVATDAELDALLQPAGAEAARRVAALRSGEPLNRERTRIAYGSAVYAGVCLQGGRDEEEGAAPFAPRARAWVVERVLVVADDVRAGRMAAWAEGTFVLTNRGFVAIALDRVEAPRQHHADLEMGGCDMEVGLDDHNQ